MRLTEPQLRMLRALRDSKDGAPWHDSGYAHRHRLLVASKAFSSGYRVIDALCAKGLMEPTSFDHSAYRITEAGRAALAQPST